LEMKSNESIQDYANRVDELANQVNSLTTTPADSIKDEDKVLALTRGLPEVYNIVVAAMRESGKLSDYKHVVTSLLNEETRLSGNNDNYDEKAFYGARG